MNVNAFSKIHLLSPTVLSLGRHHDITEMAIVVFSMIWFDQSHFLKILAVKKIWLPYQQ